MSHFIYSLLSILNEMSPFILLGFILAGILNEFVKPQTMSRHLSTDGWKPVLKAALIGIPLPLCSCGVLPTAVSLRRRGASHGATVSFLTATPQTGVDSIAATYSLLGLPFAVIRPVAALIGSTFGGLAVNRFASADAVTSASADGPAANCSISAETGSDKRPLWSRLVAALRYGLVNMVASVGKWLVIGLLVAALITVLVPDSLFLSLNRYPIVAMLVMVLVAVPMYICATGSIPIALSLMLKGLSPGVAFVLLMAGPAANFASVMVLNRSIGRRSTAIYLASVIITAMAFGLLIDYLLPASWFMPSASAMLSDSHCAEGMASFGWFESLCSLLLVGLLIYAPFSGAAHHRTATTNTQPLNTTTNMGNTTMEKKFNVSGMNCPHCSASVEKAIGNVAGVKQVNVSLADKMATVSGDFADSDIIRAVELAGFDCSLA